MNVHYYIMMNFSFVQFDVFIINVHSHSNFGTV